MIVGYNKCSEKVSPSCCGREEEGYLPNEAGQVAGQGSFPDKNNEVLAT